MPIRETIVEILSENRVAVIGQARFVKALPFSRRNFGQLFLRKRVTTLDADPGNARLQAFFDRDLNSKLRRIALIFFVQLARDFGLPVAAAAIQTLYPADILFKQHFAIAPVTEQSPGSLVLHMGTN